MLSSEDAPISASFLALRSCAGKYSSGARCEVLIISALASSPLPRSMCRTYFCGCQNLLAVLGCGLAVLAAKFPCFCRPTSPVRVVTARHDPRVCKLFLRHLVRLFALPLLFICRKDCFYGQGNPQLAPPIPLPSLAFRVWSRCRYSLLPPTFLLGRAPGLAFEDHRH